ncbi:MAG: DMT family transporter [Cohaesibacter sp.]|nr:DMT family transporter [Cohaesibacter sp.]
MTSKHYPSQSDRADQTHPLSSPSQNLWIGIALAAIGSLLFSTKAIFAKLAYAAGDLPVETMLALRMSIALPFFLITGLRLLQKEPARRTLLSPGLLIKTGLIGILGYYCASFLDFSGLKYLTAQMERLILFTYPLFVVLFGALFFKQTLTKWTILSFAISYAGLAILFSSSSSRNNPDLTIGALFVLGSAISFALYQLLAKELITKMGSRLFTSFAMSAAAIATLMHFSLLHPLQNIWVNNEIGFYVTLIAIFSTVIPAYMLNEALNRIGPQMVGMLGNLSPLFTTTMAIFILGEAFGPYEAIGTLVVLSGIVLFSHMDQKAKKQAQKSTKE